MTEEQKKQIENRINWIYSHSYDSILSAEWKGIDFTLKALGYCAICEFNEYKIIKINWVLLGSHYQMATYRVLECSTKSIFQSFLGEKNVY